MYSKIRIFTFNFPMLNNLCWYSNC